MTLDEIIKEKANDFAYVYFEDEERIPIEEMTVIGQAAQNTVIDSFKKGYNSSKPLEFAEWIDKERENNRLDRARDINSKNYGLWMDVSSLKVIYYTTEELYLRFLNETK